MVMGLYGALRDPVSGLLALPPVRLMIVAVLTNLALTPLLSKPAMPLSDFSECQPDAVWKDTCWSKAYPSAECRLVGQVKARS